MNRARPHEGRVGRAAIAALKTHALQVLARPASAEDPAKRLECVRFVGAFAPVRIQGRFMVPMRTQSCGNGGFL